MSRSCGWCGRNFKTLTKSLAETTLCASCWRMWTRPTMDEALEDVAPQVFRTIVALRNEGHAWVKVLSGVRSKHGREAVPGRDWDEPLLIAAHHYWKETLGHRDPEGTGHDRRGARALRR